MPSRGLLTLGLPTPERPRLRQRPPDSHKGSFGHALLVGGSRGMAGSISLSAKAALHAGAGLVTQAVPDRILDSVALLNPCAMCIPLLDDTNGYIAADAFAQIEARFDRTACIALGPGLGRTANLQEFVRRLVVESPMPCVIDADALNNLADSGGWTGVCAGPRVLTPHPGEWARLSGCEIADTDAQRREALSFARENNVILVLKGHQTLVTDGDTAYLNQTGTPAMATGGSGDVLTGVIAALICQGLNARDAAHLAVYAHGLAGQMAEAHYQSHVVLADQLIEFISRAFFIESDGQKNEKGPR